MSRVHAGIAAASALLLASAASAAPEQPISLRDTFRIGSGGSVLCSAQTMGIDRALTSMFDRGYSIVCRDAAVPVGSVYALRTRGSDPAARLAKIREEKVQCQAPAQARLEELGEVTALDCRLREADVAYRVYMKREGNILYVAEGLGGYDSALRLGLRTVVADAPVQGEVSVATTGAGNPAAFARVQAGTLDPQRALAEAYRRNNAGSYAEAAEFFATLAGSDDAGSRAEALVNEALQKSNLGRYAEADALFLRAQQALGNDPVVARQLRNYRAMHLLNRGQPKAALAELDKPLPAAAALRSSAAGELVIDSGTAARLNAESPVSRQLGAAGSGLLPEERAQILDGQALQLRGSALRLEGDHAAAAEALERAQAQLLTVRSGRVSSVVWMRAQILGELASIAEARGDAAEAERQYRASVAVLQVDYPGSSAVLSAQGRLAAYLARTGRTADAMALYREIIKANASSVSPSPTLARVLAPYFKILVEEPSREGAAADLFEASQVLVRPGVAQTQAVLARELSGGSDEAARLFRQSVTLTRQIERGRVELARLETLPQPSAVDAERIATLRASLEQMEEEQAVTQAKLADFPRYRAVSSGAIGLADLQQLLRDGEAYYKMTVVGDDVYGLYASAGAAKIFRIDATPKQLEEQVTSLRDTISTEENGALVTLPFNADLAHHLYQLLFTPVGQEIGSVRHLVFEPDGAMLRLPPNLLVMDAAGVEAYRKRAARPGDDGFDFTGIQWLGRDRDISTAASARAFRDLRLVRRSDAKREYLGFGENVPVQGAAAAPPPDASQLDCSWSLDAWNRPISAKELFVAQSLLAGGRPTEAQVITGNAFTDTAIKNREDLDEYRILHFATHGLVTAPRRRCPAQPALMTSFGAQGSDGLLTFREIFDLRLDADLVILSACDTAGRASVAATREAGLATGGDFALDGLVRAFVGAGGRLVIASHWPVPDDYDATQRLISGLFTAPPGTGTAAALRHTQRQLMDDAKTSHPFYWSGFAVIGDGETPVVFKD